MSTLEIWLLAVSLAIDCFTVSVTSGIILKRISWSTLLTMGFFFGLFQALMPFSDGSEPASSATLLNLTITGLHSDCWLSWESG